MFLVIHFPVSDSRRFLPGVSLLPAPNWPTPFTESQFQRYFGPIKRRPLGGIQSWIGENEICEASRALNFANRLGFSAQVKSSSFFLDPRRLFGRKDEAQAIFTCAFKRFYFDGIAVGKFEVGIRPKPGLHYHRVSFTRDQFANFITGFLKSPVRLPRAAGYDDAMELGLAGAGIARLFLRSSLRSKQNATPLDWSVRAGRPLLLLEYRAGDELPPDLPFSAKQVLKEEGAEGVGLYQCFVPYSGAELPLWVLDATRYESLGRARTLRLNLLRLYAEHQCIRLVLDNIRRGNLVVEPRSSESQILQNYFDKTLTKIGETKNRSAKQFGLSIAETAQESMARMLPGHREALMQQIEYLDLRRNLARNLRSYVGNWAEIGTLNIIEQGDNVMGNKVGDNYDIRDAQIGAVGPNSTASNNTFLKIGSELGQEIDLDTLAKELAVLRQELLQRASTREQTMAVGAVAAAEAAAEEKDSKGVLEHLKQAGAWALDIAGKIGVNVATAALKQSLGIP